MVGFGGYPALPALLAATSAKIPTVIHEQNAVLGRVNRFLAGAGRCDRHRLSARSSGSTPKLAAQGPSGRQSGARRSAGAARRAVPAVHRGRPVARAGHRRQPGRARAVRSGARRAGDAAARAAPPPAGDPAVPPRGSRRGARSAMPGTTSRPNSAPISRTWPSRLADAHLFIGRAGASTIAELTAVGRPAILVPLPIATDDHQAANAREMVAAGGARAIRQHELHRQGTGQADPGDGAASRNARQRRARARGTAASPTPRATSPIWSRASAASR